MDLKGNLALNLKDLELISKASWHSVQLKWPLEWNWSWTLITYLFVVLYSLYYLWHRLLSFQGLPKNLSWATAEHQSIISRGKASIKSIFGLNDLLADGYVKVSGMVVLLIGKVFTFAEPN